MLKKFYPITAPNKEILIWYLQEGLQLSIQVQIDSWYQKLDFWDKVLDKAIKAKSKAALQSPTSIWEIDTCYWKN